MVYMVNGVRFGFLGQSEVDPNLSLAVLTAAVVALDVCLFKRGYGLTDCFGRPNVPRLDRPKSPDRRLKFALVSCQSLREARLNGRTQMSNSPLGGRPTTTQTYVVVVVAAVLVSALLAPVAYDRASQPDGAVAVVTIDGFISSTSVDNVAEDLREVRENESVKAVVLKVDSPGGSAAASERLYMEVKRTANAMPVVASVQSTAASGAYYAMLPAETIHVTPASIVGSVGVRGAAPGPTPSGEIRSGPDKASMTADRVRRQIETLQRAFVGTVMAERGDRIELSRTEVAHAKVYTGARAVDNGMADRIGTLSDATNEAADAAGLDDYETYRKEPALGGGLLLLSSEDGDATVVVEEGVGFDAVDSRTYLMVYGDVQYENEVIENVSS